MRRSTVGQLLIEDSLPEDMRDLPRTLDAKGIRNLCQEIATKHPDKYRDVVQKLMMVGHDAMYSSGGYSAGLRHMRTSAVFARERMNLQKQIDQIVSDPKLTPDQRDQKIIETIEKVKPGIEKAILDEGLASKNPFALQVSSGSKGKPFNLRGLIGSDLLYENHRGSTLPIAILKNYSEGLSPAEYWAGTYGARKGVVDLKTATQDAGYFGKQLTQAAHRLLVTAQDSDQPHDESSPRGYPSDINDPDNEGALLAHPVGTYKRNTVLTPKVLAHLKDLGHEHILVRSPTVGGPADGGVYAHDVGIRERGHISPVGDFVGIGAAQSLAEPISQAQIGCLAQGTLVRMYDGTSKPIEQIEVGDLVLGANISGYTFPVRVTYTFDKGIQDLVKTVFDNGSTLISTVDHKILSINDLNQHEIIPIKHLLRNGSVVVNDKYINSELVTDNQEQSSEENSTDCSNNRSNMLTCDLYGQESSEADYTYDIEVDHPDGLFVLTNGLIVSNSKHTGGVAGAGGGVSGFKAINQLVQIPKVFTGGASYSQTDGKVESVSPAPGGGYNVFINGQRHYVGIDRNLKIKPGDTVEAGDMLSDGLPNPNEVTTHKGLGEGRRVFIDAFRKAAQDAGFTLHRRNIELVARGLINHVKLTEPYGDHITDDIIPYNTLEHIYQPRDGHRIGSPNAAVGQYLERPVLHYTIGTRVTPSVVKQLEKFGVKHITTHQDQPGFEPHMVRGIENLSHDSDWMTRMLGSHLEKGLLRGVHRGSTSDEAGTSYVPSLARGVDFGKIAPIKGWSTADLIQNMSKPPSTVTSTPVKPVSTEGPKLTTPASGWKLWR